MNFPEFPVMARNAVDAYDRAALTNMTENQKQVASYNVQAIVHFIGTAITIGVLAKCLFASAGIGALVLGLGALYVNTGIERQITKPACFAHVAARSLAVRIANKISSIAGSADRLNHPDRLSFYGITLFFYPLPFPAN